MFNPFRKKVKAPSGIALTPIKSMYDIFMEESGANYRETNIVYDPYEINRTVRGMTDEEISEAAKDSLRFLVGAIPYQYLQPKGVGIFPDTPDVKIPIPMKIEPCAYCGSRCVADYRGNCRSCGAPK